MVQESEHWAAQTNTENSLGTDYPKPTDIPPCLLAHSRGKSVEHVRTLLHTARHRSFGHALAVLLV